MPPNLARNLAAACAMSLIAAVGGCKSHQLRGVVVEGEHPRVELVDPGDARLDIAVVPEARVSLTLDPTSLNPQPLAELISDPNGAFVTDISAIGAGVLQYDLGVLCQAEGFKTLYQTMPMPKRGRVLLVVLAPGHDRHRPPGDFLRETERMGDDLLRR
jgi:hypothetical protein